MASGSLSITQHPKLNVGFAGDKIGLILPVHLNRCCLYELPEANVGPFCGILSMQVTAVRTMGKLPNRKTPINVTQQSEVLSRFRMSAFVRYLTHPQVLIDPLKDVRTWSLNSLGSARVSALAARPGTLSRTRRVISSDETKALETAAPLALALGVKLEVRAQMHENDRTATGFLPPEEFEKVADKFFAEPSRSVRGWEKAEAAQSRILAEVDACLEGPQNGDICSLDTAVSVLSSSVP